MARIRKSAGAGLDLAPIGSGKKNVIPELWPHLAAEIKRDSVEAAHKLAVCPNAFYSVALCTSALLGCRRVWNIVFIS